MVSEHLSSNGFGQKWGHTLSYTNRLDAPYQGPNGNNWFIREAPQLAKDANGNLAVIGIVQDPLWFNKVDDGFGNITYVARYFIKETLTETTSAKEFTFTGGSGRVLKFFSFDGSIPAAKQGQFKSFIDPYGNASDMTYNGSNRISEFVQGSVASGINVRYKYDYFASGEHASRIQYVTQKRNDTINVRRAVNSYYPSSSSSSGDGGGSGGDLKAVTTQAWNSTSSTWEDIGTSYYRYYKAGDTNGFAHALKYVVGPEAYARMLAAGHNPAVATDLTLGSYADHYFEYDSSKRVTREKVRGGLQTFDFAYSASTNSDGYNSWRTQTTETLPNSNQNVVYSNYAGQVMLKQFISGGSTWYEYYKYDDSGNIIQRAESNAVLSAYDSSAGIVDLKDTAGLIRVFEYYTTTDVPNGAVAGFVKAEKVKQGETGTEIKIKEFKYTSRTDGTATIYPLWKEILYPSDTNQSITEETEYVYTWHGSSLQMQSRKTIWPTVTTDQNGSGSPTFRVEWFDSYGRLTWLQDERRLTDSGTGFLTRWKYDESSGGLVQRIDDVDTSQITDSPPVPSGWATRSGGGAHIKTDLQHDDLGRMTQELGPSHTIDLSGTATAIRRARWIVYKDTIQQVWEGAGYATGTSPSYTYTLVNPVRITKIDRLRRITDEIVATRASTSGKLAASDSFAQSTWVRWRKVNFDNNQRLTFERLYHLIPSSGDGASGTNYNQTDFDYDAMFRRKKTKSPGGTIRRTVFHARGWPVSMWIGTNDTGATDSNPAGSGSPNNMVKVEEREYDSGADEGNGLLTKLTRHENASTVRETLFLYDWRNRRTDTDGEVDFYRVETFDNLDRVIQRERRDTSPGGYRIALQEISYDSRGRIYRTTQHAVNPTNSQLGNSVADNIWYGPTGKVIKQKLAGSSALYKFTYDSLERITARYVSFHTALGAYAEETAYADAGNVIDDKVFEQVEFSYDAASNTIERRLRKRFDGETSIGALGNPTTSPKARVSYLAIWPDARGRTRKVADYGTNGGTALSRPSTAPTGSDTVLATTNDYNERGERYQVTHPNGIKTNLQFDHAGRKSKLIKNYVDGTPSGDTDIAIEFTYNADHRPKTITAVNGTTGNQVTKYVYGTTLSDSDVASNDLLRAIIYSDSDDGENPLGNGPDGIHDRVELGYNRLGEPKEKKDEMQNVHVFEYDELGRRLHDRVTAFGSGVDQTVKRVSYVYEVRGMLKNVTSYDNASVGAGNVVTDVEASYDDFGLSIAEYQSHSGAVNTGSTPQVQYGYADGSANHARRTSLTYPNGRVTTYDYGAAGGDDDVLSRVSALKHGTTTLAAYTRLGLERTVKVSYAEPGVDLSYKKQTGESDGTAGDQYTGLDSFDRVTDQRWIKISTGTALERVQYGFDRANNQKWRDNLVSSGGQDEYYTYDGIDRLTNLDRGDLNAGKTAITGTPTREEDFTYDPTGNWTNYTPKTNGTNDFSQTRTHNKANEITQIDGVTTHIAHNVAGNSIKVPKVNSWTASYDLTYDAWNRLVKVAEGANTVAEYVYDGRSRRVVKKTYSAGVLDATRHYYYSAGWQVLEERLNTSSTADRQFVWGLRYVDDLILRDRGSERLYALHDYFSVTAIVNTSGVVQERYGYDAFGFCRVMNASFGSASSTYDWETRYAAYRFDFEAGFYQVRHRYLHPKLGRWINRDPKRSGSNWYALSGNDPVSSVDPLGLQQHRLVGWGYVPPDLIIYFYEIYSDVVISMREEHYGDHWTYGPKYWDESLQKCLQTQTQYEHWQLVEVVVPSVSLQSDYFKLADIECKPPPGVCTPIAGEYIKSTSQGTRPVGQPMERTTPLPDRMHPPKTIELNETKEECCKPEEEFNPLV